MTDFETGLAVGFLTAWIVAILQQLLKEIEMKYIPNLTPTPVAFFGGEDAGYCAAARAHELETEGFATEVFTVSEYEYITGDKMGEDPLAEYGVKTTHIVVEY